MASHVNPDGDAIGSLTGLGAALQRMGKSVTMLCPTTPMPPSLAFIPWFAASKWTVFGRLLWHHLRQSAPLLATFILLAFPMAMGVMLSRYNAREFDRIMHAFESGFEPGYLFVVLAFSGAAFFGLFGCTFVLTSAFMPIAMLLTIAFLQGLSMLAAVLAVYLWAVLAARPDDVVRSVTFAALVLGNLALILVNRSWRLPVWQTFTQRRNPTLRWILPVAVVLLVVLVTVPALRRVFDFGPLAAVDWIVALAASVVGVTWFELFKLRRGARTHDARGRARPGAQYPPALP